MLEDYLNNNKDQVSRKDMMNVIAGSCLGVTAMSETPLFGDTKTNGIKVLNINMNGGQTHVDFWDPKPGNLPVIGKTTAIRTNTGIEVGSHIPKLAKHFDKIGLIRSMSSPEGDHQRGTYLNDTSYRMIGTIKHPGFGPMLHRFRGDENKLNPDLPASVIIGSNGGSNGYMEAKYAAFKVGDPMQGLGSLVPDNAMNKTYKERLRLMIEMGKDFRSKYNFQNVKGYSEYYNDAVKMMSSKDVNAFDLNSESKATLDRYNSRFAKGLLLAKKLLHANVQYVRVGMGGWDMHNNIFDDNNLPVKGAELDHALAVFLEDAAKEGLLENTVITFTTEFGRTPKVTSSRNGRDHWPKAYSQWMAGYGIKGGTVHGATDENAEKVIKDKVTPMNFNHTVGQLVGLSRHKEIYSPDNRPFMLVREEDQQMINGIVKDEFKK